MDHYTAERLFLDRQRAMRAEVARRALLLAGRPRDASARAWFAGRLRAVADRIEGTQRLQRVV
ncbi:MAG TPA: hypothetical protein VJR46_11785 [Candidatus Dormibacteraeota bacterium]|nr:hypothetical protein [Candidatus Dormibacteraeota bacterium]